MPYTYRDLIRKYSADVMAGTSDADLTATERRLTGVLLNVASNYTPAVTDYPPTDTVRDDTVRYLSDILWNGARACMDALAPRSDVAVSTAIERAVMILRNL